jgi:hypothetical protein
VAGEPALVVRKLYVAVDEERPTPAAAADGEAPLRKAAAAAVVANPFAGRYVVDLSEMIAWGAPLGTLLGEEAVKALGAPALSYGKGAVVGTDGEQEHGVALLTTLFGDALRAQVGGGAAWISSATKRGPAGTLLDVPLAHKDALYVRDHYDAVEVRVPDAPLPREIVVIAAVANRGRLGARCGGIPAREIEGRDGLR